MYKQRNSFNHQSRLFLTSLIVLGFASLLLLIILSHIYIRNDQENHTQQRVTQIAQLLELHLQHQRHALAQIRVDALNEATKPCAYLGCLSALHYQTDTDMALDLPAPFTPAVLSLLEHDGGSAFFNIYDASGHYVIYRALTNQDYLLLAFSLEALQQQLGAWLLDNEAVFIAQPEGRIVLGKTATAFKTDKHNLEHDVTLENGWNIILQHHAQQHPLWLSLAVPLLLAWLVVLIVSFLIYYSLVGRVKADLHLSYKLLNELLSDKRLETSTLPRFTETGRLLRLAEQLVDKIKHAKRNPIGFSYRDKLTQLPNRNYLRTELNRFFELALQETAVCLVMISIDNLEKINDEQGSRAGDRLLKVLSEELQKLARQEDLISRLGGAEFAVILVDMSPEYVNQWFGQLHKRFNTFQLTATTLNADTHIATISGGYTYLDPEQDKNALEGLRRANQALTDSKAQGLFLNYVSAAETHLNRQDAE